MMNQILQDIKTGIILLCLSVWNIICDSVAGVILFVFDLADLKVSKEYTSIIVWYIGAIAGLVYLFYRATEMIHKSRKARIEKEILELELKSKREK